MFCIQCGKEISDTAKICGYCGKKVDKETPVIHETEPVLQEPSVPEPVPQEAVVQETAAPEPVPEPDLVEVPIPQPAFTPEPREIKIKRGIPGWLLGVLGVVGVIVVIGAVFIISNGGLFTPREPKDQLPADLPENEPQESGDQSSSSSVDQERLSSPIVGQDWVEDIDFSNPNPALGERFERGSAGGIRVWGEGEDKSGYFDLAHGLSEGKLVFVKYRFSEGALFSLYLRHGEYGPGYRTIVIDNQAGFKQAWLGIDTDFFPVEDFPDEANRPNYWYEVIFALAPDRETLVREEGPAEFYHFYDFLGDDFDVDPYMLRLRVYQGEVEVEQVIIFEFDEFNLDY